LLSPSVAILGGIEGVLFVGFVVWQQEATKALTFTQRKALEQ